MTDRSDVCVPLVLVAVDTDLAALHSVQQSAGWRAQRSWELPREPWDVSEAGIVCVGRVDDRSTAAAAVLAAARGAGVVAAIDPETELAVELGADLAQLGPVCWEVARPAVESLGLTPDQRDVLRLVAEGLTLREAAEQLFLSMRTAERRLAQARKALGVTSTAQAVLRYLEHGGGDR